MPGFRVRVPATSANLGPGYDSFGLALGIYDEIDCVIESQPVTTDVVEITGAGADTLPRDASHLIYRVMTEVARAEYGAALDQVLACVRLHCDNVIPHARGMGSSAAAVVAGIFIAAELGRQASLPELTPARALVYANDYEGHPDNAAPAIFGEVTISTSSAAEVQAAVLPVSTVHELVLVVPEDKLNTSAARACLPGQIAHASAARNAARTGLLVHALLTDSQWLMDATRDELHQEFRREVYGPAMSRVDRLRAAGYPAVISGAGPTVLVFVPGEPGSGLQTADDISAVLAEPTVRVIPTSISSTGATITHLP